MIEIISYGKIKFNNLVNCMSSNSVKPGIEFESYLSQHKIVKHRTAVTRFRISAHKFPIETGRYANIEHDLRGVTPMVMFNL